MLPDTQSRVVIALLIPICLLKPNFKNVDAVPTKDDIDATVVTIIDIQRLGEANLDDATRGYIGSGAGQEQTLNENTAAFRRLRFRPRSLVDVAKIQTATTVLGRKNIFSSWLLPFRCTYDSTRGRRIWNCKSGSGRRHLDDCERRKHSLVGRHQG
ncbi:hypothetical protein MRX96_005918 [Rhipicephalus microplus]